jgi:hypothetical protein
MTIIIIFFTYFIFIVYLFIIIYHNLCKSSLDFSLNSSAFQGLAFVMPLFFASNYYYISISEN